MPNIVKIRHDVRIVSLLSVLETSLCLGQFRRARAVQYPDAGALHLDQTLPDHPRENARQGLRDGAQEARQLILGDIQFEVLTICSLLAHVEQVRCKPSRHLFEREVFDQHRKFAQAPGQNRQHVEGQGRISLDEFDKASSWKEKDPAFLERLGMGPKWLPRKHRWLAQGLSRLEQMEDLLLF